MENVYEVIKKYNKKDIYPFHMPGHKRIPQEIFKDVHPYEVDYTEVDGLDDLHEPAEMYRSSMDRMKEFYRTKETFYLVNGSTSGIMASIAAVCDLGDTIIIGRNCHKSVYRAVELLGLHPVYLYPEVDAENGIVINMEAEQVRAVVDNYPEAKAVLLVSPTYEGMVMDIRAIANVTKKQGISLIVDEAHGAHFSFGEDFPESAVGLGADIVIQSMHKTMPAFTQTALLHVCTDRISVKKMRESIDCFESTSPSYLLAASIDDAFLFGKNRKKDFHQYFCKLMEFRREMERLNHLSVIQTDDPGKIVISTSKTNMTGKELYDILLKKYHLQMEMAQETYCLAMTSICDTDEGFERLKTALLNIDRTLERNLKKTVFLGKEAGHEMYCIPYRAKRMPQKDVLLEESSGMVSGEYIYLYPPGIPFLVPGEVIHDDCIRKMKEYKIQSLNIKGLKQKEQLYITVLDR